MHFTTLVFSAIWLSLATQAYVLDSSCDSISDKLNEIIEEAFKLSSAAEEVLKGPRIPEDPNIRDLYAMLFKPPGEDWAETGIIRARDDQRRESLTGTFERVNQFKTPSQDKSNINDVVIYCNFNRFVEGIRTENGVKYARDKDTGREIKMDNGYEKCKTQLNSDRTMGETTSNAGGDPASPGPDQKISQIQLCKWFVDMIKYKKPLFTTWAKFRPKVNIAKVVSKWLKFTGEMTPMDGAALFEHTLLHELTHAIKDERYHCRDIERDNFYGSYGWKNCMKQAAYRGSGNPEEWLEYPHKNAESLAFFGLGVRMITFPDKEECCYRPSRDGTVTKL